MHISLCTDDIPDTNKKNANTIYIHYEAKIYEVGSPLTASWASKLDSDANWWISKTTAWNFYHFLSNTPLIFIFYRSALTSNKLIHVWCSSGCLWNAYRRSNWSDLVNIQDHSVKGHVDCSTVKIVSNSGNLLQSLSYSPCPPAFLVTFHPIIIIKGEVCHRKALSKYICDLFSVQYTYHPTWSCFQIRIP